jgi:hypothetical protein
VLPGPPLRYLRGGRKAYANVCSLLVDHESG